MKNAFKTAFGRGHGRGSSSGAVTPTTMASSSAHPPAIDSTDSAPLVLKSNPPVITPSENRLSSPTPSPAPPSAALQSPSTYSANPDTYGPPYNSSGMAFAGAHHVNASHGIFSEVHGNMYNSYHYNPNVSLNPDVLKTISYVPLPHNQNFTGQDVYLDTLRRYFVPRDTCYPSRRFLVHGVGGAGKTQICLRLAEELTSRLWRIFWVDATTEESMELSLQSIASDPEARSFGVERSVESVLRWLGTVRRDWLIVFDNADDSVVRFMPPGNRGNILFTSRNPNLADLAADYIEVNGMEIEDAISLLLKSARIDEFSVEARNAAGPIVKELFCLPLAVSQAGAAIRSRLCGLGDYLHMYHQHRHELLADAMFRGASNYGRAVYGTWDLSFLAIRKMGSRDAESAIIILRIFAFFHHENISEEILKRAAESSMKRASSIPPQLDQLLQVDRNGDWDPFFFRGGIRILLSFSLIKKAGIEGFHSLHPLVHCWIRDSMSNEERQASYFLSCILLSSSIEYRVTSENFIYRQTLIPHIKAVKSESQICYNAEWYAAFALAFRGVGHWKDAEELECQVMETRKRLLGEEHPDTLTSVHNLAVTYSHQGRWREAEELGIRVIETRKRVIGEEHPGTLSSMHNLALTYLCQGRYKEAEELGIQVTETRKRVFGEEHPDTLVSMHGLASIYLDQGRWQEAEELGTQVIENRKKLLGEEHSDTLASMHSLALTYWHQNYWKEAEELSIQVIAMEKTVLGEEHPYTLASMHNLASTYLNQERYKEAEELGVRVTETKKGLLGEDHPDTLGSMHNLTSTYLSQGRYKEAEELGTQVTEARIRVLGVQHPDTLTSMHNVMLAHSCQGRWKEAEELGAQVTKTRKRVLGEDHPDTLVSIHHLASTYLYQGRWKEAEELGIQVTVMRKRVLGEEHPDTLAAMHNLTLAYMCQGRWKEAEELGIQVTERRKMLLGEDHPGTLMGMYNLALAYRNQGRCGEAEELGKRVTEARKRLLGEDHPDTLMSMHHLALTYRNQERYKEAEELANQVTETRKRILERHPDALSRIHKLMVTPASVTAPRRTQSES